MKRLFAFSLFLLLLLSSLPLSAALTRNEFYYSDVLPLWKDPATADEAFFLDGLWGYEILDLSGGTFSLPSVRKADDDGSFYAAPQDDSCRILEGVSLCPSAAYAPVLTFTAPVDGTLNYTLFGYARKDHGGNAPFVLLYLDGEQILTEELSFDSGNTSDSLELEVLYIEVKAGQKLRLAVTGDGSLNPFCISGAPTVRYTEFGESAEIPSFDLTVSDLMPTSANLSWSAVPSAVRYEVLLDGDIVSDPGYNRTSFSFPDLRAAGVEYSVSVIAYNQAGEVLALSSECSFFTPEEETSFVPPQPGEYSPEEPVPQNLRLVSVYPDCFYIAWDPVCDGAYYNGYINGEIFFLGHTGSTGRVYVPAEPGGVYRVYVTYEGETGESAPSQTLTVTCPTGTNGADSSASDPSAALPGAEKIYFPLIAGGAILLLLVAGVVLLLRRK